MITWEYAAGFIDGEGCFSIHEKCQRLTVSNLNVAVLFALQERFGGKGRITTKKNGVSEYTLGSLGMRRYLPELIPHLLVKRELAELLLAYLGPIPERRPGFDYSPHPDELARRRVIRDRVKAINGSRGRLAYGHARGV